MLQCMLNEMAGASGNGMACQVTLSPNILQSFAFMYMPKEEVPAPASGSGKKCAHPNFKEDGPPDSKQSVTMQSEIEISDSDNDNEKPTMSPGCIPPMCTPTPKPTKGKAAARPRQKAAEAAKEIGTEVVNEKKAQVTVDETTLGALEIEECLQMLMGVAQQLPKSWLKAETHELFIQSLTVGSTACNARTDHGRLALVAIPFLVQLALDCPPNNESLGRSFTNLEALDFKIFVALCIFRPAMLTPLYG
ncbi:hypothetical protein C2E23DRAFT_860325 [Lenzites betulinus]|nr:hypothetical protein C2E23DRAFT_860325 [Lenzites betulinus]